MSNHRIEGVPAVAAMFKALSNEHRLRIFLRLLECCPTPSTACCEDEAFGACVGDLGRDLDIAASTVSHHIKELHHAGLIVLERDGRYVQCSAVPEAVERMRLVLDRPSAPVLRATCKTTGGCS